MLTPYEIDRRCAELALKTGAPTPGHVAAEGAVDGQEPDEAEQRRLRFQHLADPLAEPAEVPEVAVADLDKAYRDGQAFQPPAGYPEPRRVSAEEFRRGPLAAGHAAYSAAYEAPGRPVPVASEAMNAARISRPLMTDGRARPRPPGGQ
jgi:hypothetical protein